jgi:ABC-type phosphate transport system permease subunit
MSTLLLAAAEEHETWGGVNNWVIGALTLLVLMAVLGALIAFGGGREHS